MRILVTGSEGFIGKHLVYFLNKKGYEIVPFDKVKGQDLLNEKHLTKVFKKNIDYIIHLAAYGDVYKAIKDPVGALIAGPAATASLIKVASKFPIKKIVYASTWEVYGKPIYSPINENHPCFPLTPYSIAKYAGELVIKSVNNSIPWIILRLGSVYGPNMRPYAVIPLFIKNALRKKSVILHDKGKQKRQFVYIDDVCNAFFKAIKSKIKNEIINVVGNEVVSVKNIAQKINQLIPLKIILGKKRLGDPASAIISNEKAKKKLKWEPKVSFDEGIAILISELKSKE